jgi:hypothetical protein
MMRFFPLLLIPTALLAQSASTIYQTDINGRRVAVGSQDQGVGGTTLRTQSVNGRQVPSEQTTERIVSQGPGSKVVERTVQKFDPTGRSAGTERVTVEETSLPGGGKLLRETRAITDINGRFSPTERVTTEIRVSGQTTTTSVTVDKPSTNQGFQTAERRSTVAVGPIGQQHSTETIERLDVSGHFRPVARTESKVQVAGDRTTANTAAYELDGLGKLSLTKQTVATTTKRPDGGASTVTDVYGTATAGVTMNTGSGPRLLEQRVTERQIAADGTVSDSVILRVPNPSDPSKLGNAQKISETICTGKCLPPAPAPAATAPVPAVAASAKQTSAAKK